MRRHAFKIPSGGGNRRGYWRVWKVKPENLESGCSFSEGSEVVTLIGSEVCLVAAASASRAAAEMSEGYEPWSLAQSAKFKPKCV